MAPNKDRPTRGTAQPSEDKTESSSWLSDIIGQAEKRRERLFGTQAEQPDLPTAVAQNRAKAGIAAADRTKDATRPDSGDDQPPPNVVPAKDVFVWAEELVEKFAGLEPRIDRFQALERLSLRTSDDRVEKWVDLPTALACITFGDQIPEMFPPEAVLDSLIYHVDDGRFPKPFLIAGSFYWRLREVEEYNRTSIQKVYVRELGNSIKRKDGNNLEPRAAVEFLLTAARDIAPKQLSVLVAVAKILVAESQPRSKGSPTSAPERWDDRPSEIRRGKGYLSPSEFIATRYQVPYEAGDLGEDDLARSDPSLLAAYKRRIAQIPSERLSALKPPQSDVERLVELLSPVASRLELRRLGQAITKRDQRVEKEKTPRRTVQPK